jgi:RNA polymerase sigma-70 factor (ECF subfamily)
VMTITQEQFEQSVPQYQRLVMSVCLSFTHNYFDAEDLAQETFLSAYRHLDRFDGSNFKAWLTTIAANKCRDYLRSPARAEVELSDEAAENIRSGSDPPELRAEKSSSDQRVKRVCESLSEPYRSVATAYFCRGEKLSELAEHTGQNLKTLQTQLYRSKKMLRELWEEDLT